MTQKTYVITITDNPEQHCCSIHIENSQFSIVERFGVLVYAMMAEILTLSRIQQPPPSSRNIQ